MATRTKSKPQPRGFVLFDVVYEDDSFASNRRVPAEALSDPLAALDPDAAARAAIEAQDQAIAEKSGRPRLAIKRLSRSRG